MLPTDEATASTLPAPPSTITPTAPNTAAPLPLGRVYVPSKISTGRLIERSLAPLGMTRGCLPAYPLTRLPPYPPTRL